MSTKNNKNKKVKNAPVDTDEAPESAPAAPVKKGKVAKAKAPAAPKKESAGKDAFGGRIGSRSNKINAVLIGGFIGTAADIAKEADEPVANVSAQLSWLKSRGFVIRKERESGAGFVYKKAKNPGANGKPAKAAPAEEASADEETTVASE